MSILEHISNGIAGVATAVVVWGVLIGAARIVRAEVGRLRQRAGEPEALEPIRHDVGIHLLLGLEFLIAADIVRTIVDPTLEELAILAATVGIRTVISFFLGQEIERWESARRVVSHFRKRPPPPEEEEAK